MFIKILITATQEKILKKIKRFWQQKSSRETYRTIHSVNWIHQFFPLHNHTSKEKSNSTNKIDYSWKHLEIVTVLQKHVLKRSRFRKWTIW